MSNDTPTPGSITRTQQDAPRPATVIVTGAGGWLGQNLVRALAPTRTRIRCLVHNPAEAAALELAGSGVEVLAGDVRDPDSVDRLFEGLSAMTVVHAAAVIHPRRPREFYDINVGGTQHVLDRARRAGVSRFIQISSNSPFGANPGADHRFTEESPYNPYMGYGKSKHEAEQLVSRSYLRGDVASVILRPPWFYGPFQPQRQTQWLAAVRRGRFPLVGDGTNRRSMVFTGNLVDAILRAEVASAAPGNAYWIADAEPYGMSDVFATVRRALEAEGLTTLGRIRHAPKLIGDIAERVDQIAQSLGRYLQPIHVLGELKDTIACDISRARIELGYAPAVALEEGMRLSIRWCLDRGYAL